MYKLIREWEPVELDSNLPIYIDTETGKDDQYTKGGLYGQIRLIQLYQEGWEEVVIYDCLFVDLHSVLDLIKDHHLVFHNAPYDLHTINLYTYSFWYPAKVSDTFALSKVHFFTENRFDFYSCLRYAGLEDVHIKGIDKKKNQKADWIGPLDRDLISYAVFDVYYLWQLHKVVKAQEENEVYLLDIANLEYAIEYARRGIPVNQTEVNIRLLDVTTKLENLLETLPVNPNSPKQCQALLNCSSTDNDTLTKMKLEGNKIAGDISEARTLTKLRGRLLKFSRPIIRGFYNPYATISGRMSCTGGDRHDHDNLQNIPRTLLDCLEAPEGYVFVYKDYAGLELRMAVAYTGEPTMERLMRMEVDGHTHTAHKAFNVPFDDVTKKQRTVGKVLNFNTIYGGQVAAIQATLRSWGGLIYNFKEVKQFINTWFGEYEYFDVWHNIHKNHFKVYNYLDVTTALGRKIRAYQYTDSLNYPIQGSSAEVTKMSLKYLKDRYGTDENLISTIHDSNTLLVREDQAEVWVDRLNECMIDAWYYVIKDLAIPDLPMPPEAEYSIKWDF